MLSFGLLPVVTRPTRITHTTATLIDHVFVSNNSKLHNSGIILSHISDHFPTFYVDQSKSKQQKGEPFKVKKINKETQNYLNLLVKQTYFDHITSDTNPESSFSIFFNLWNNLTYIAFPEMTVKPKVVSSFAHTPWMSTGHLNSCKTKQKLFSKKLSKPTEQNKNKFKDFNTIYNAVRRKAKKKSLLL